MTSRTQYTAETEQLLAGYEKLQSVLQYLSTQDVATGQDNAKAMETVISAQMEIYLADARNEGAITGEFASRARWAAAEFWGRYDYAAEYATYPAVCGRLARVWRHLAYCADPALEAVDAAGVPTELAQTLSDGVLDAMHEVRSVAERVLGVDAITATRFCVSGGL